MSTEACSHPATDSTQCTSTVDLEQIGRITTRYGLVLVLLWIGGMKFTAYEAEGIQGFVANSPAFAWLNSLFTVREVSAIIGLAEIAIALLIAIRPISALGATLGGAMAAGMFLSTLSFMVTTPGVFEPSLGFPALSVVPGQFLIKDAVLLGASLWCTGEAMNALHQRPAKALAMDHPTTERS